MKDKKVEAVILYTLEYLRCLGRLNEIQDEDYDVRIEGDYKDFLKVCVEVMSKG